jgi:hypothetical protein
LYKQIEDIDPKKNIKTLKKSISESRSVVEELFYKIAYAYLHETMNKTVESKEFLEEVMRRIINDDIYDEFLITHFMSMCKELGHTSMSVKIAEAKYNNNPEDQASALQLFETYVSINNFMKMNAISMKIYNMFSLPIYEIHGIQSLYMFSQSDKGMASTLDLAYMFANKIVISYGDEPIPPSFGRLYIKILRAKSSRIKAIEFIEKYPDTFSGYLERSKQIISILAERISQLKKSGNIDELQAIQYRLIEELRTVIKTNYENPPEFNCIYDLYELLISTLVDVLQHEISSSDLDLGKLYHEIQETETKGSHLFILDQGENDYNLESVKNLWTSLIYFQNFELETNKSTEAHNLRKASILSQLYLMHKLVLAGINYKHQEVAKNVFSEVAMVYARRYLLLSSLVYDLKGYFPYFNSDFMKTFENDLQENVKSKDNY